MRVLLIAGKYPPQACGVGDYSYHLGKALSALPDIELGVLTSVAPGANSRGHEVLEPLQSWEFKEISTILRRVSQFKPDVIHFQFPFPRHTVDAGLDRLAYLLPLLLHRHAPLSVQTFHERLSPVSYLPSLLARGPVIVVDRATLEFPPHYRPLLWGRQIVHIPIGSNIPAVSLTNQERTALRARFKPDEASGRLLCYFGFAVPGKGVETLLELGGENDTLVLICELNPADAYQKRLREQLEQRRAKGDVSIHVTGYLPDTEVAGIMAAADAVILPFENGVAERNGTFLAALSQDSFVLTTSGEKTGYDKENNVYYARLKDVGDLRSGLDRYAGTRGPRPASLVGTWEAIAQRHLELYQKCLKPVAKASSTKDSLSQG